MDKGKIIEFRKKEKITQEELRKQRIIENAHFLIDSCKGDFVIIFKTKDIGYLFEDDIKDSEFMIAMSDVKMRKVNNLDYFFSGLLDSGNSTYFDLDS